MISLTRLGLFFCGILFPSFLGDNLDQRESQTRPGNAYRKTSEDIGQIMTGSEDPAKADKTNNDQRRGNYERFPKNRWHFGDQQVSQQPQKTTVEIVCPLGKLGADTMFQIWLAAAGVQKRPRVNKRAMRSLYHQPSPWRTLANIV